MSLYISAAMSSPSLPQYVVYDHNSFIADVGGFLGLLLGHSIFSVYATTYDAIEKGIKRVLKAFDSK